MATHYQGKPDQKLALDVFIKFMRSYNSMQAVLRQNLSESELTVPQFGILEALHHLGPLCQHELAAKQLKSGGNITRVLDVMEKHGLVERRPEPSDRRSIRVHLTPSGEKLIGRIFPRHAAGITNMLSSLSRSEQETLNQLLRKLGTGLQALTETAEN